MKKLLFLLVVAFMFVCVYTNDSSVGEPSTVELGAEDYNDAGDDPIFPLDYEGDSTYTVKLAKEDYNDAGDDPIFPL